MKIAIIGSGNVGAALGQGWIRAGHHVLFGVRDTRSPKALRLQEIVPGAQLTTVGEACREAAVIVITTPPEAVIELLPQLGDTTDKVLIDATNSIRNRPEPYPTAFHALKALTQNNAVVKCFNSTGFENMQNPVYTLDTPASQPVGLDMFMAGNHAESKAIAGQLAKELGFEQCYDFGGDDKVELLEKFALSWINLAILQGHGRNIAFKVLRRRNDPA